MRPRRKHSCVSLLPTITEVQEGVGHFFHTQSLDDYKDSMRGLSQPSCYHPHPPQSCPQRPAKMPTPRQAKFPSSGSVAAVVSVASSPVPANPQMTLALVALGPESISLTLAPSESACGRALWWPHQDPLGWLFTQSQGAGTAVTAGTALRLVDDVQDSVCLV
ncbi:hypothetical protein AALO_G00100740 [Alosa alosa]|uniref:Uncharacterized protein n=1 Tax=Alosa alosa TaxID=278164 RepID=A0AAV6GYP1_9TELE|nr:uncharacterized protein si:ch73-6k14.2 [Alosa sapidissima]XP_048104860.1 uncharacterized protein si:ch73-6k14.2 [Alosa alosa]KAG5278601.1 hypothetical protein AALO_G00100740 [Alosa alosa]